MNIQEWMIFKNEWKLKMNEYVRMINDLFIRVI